MIPAVQSNGVMSYPHYSTGGRAVAYDSYRGQHVKPANVVVQPEVILDGNMVVPYVVVGAVAGLLAFIINPVIGIIAFFFGARACMLMVGGHTNDAVYAGRVAFWLGFLAIFFAFAAFAAVVVLQVEKPDYFTDQPKLNMYLTRVLLPIFSWRI